MPLMPGSPRPGTPVPHEHDDGVYRSLFQQPVVDIPPAAPSYAWFEFLLHPEALQKHLTTLRQQKERDVHSATSAIELVREFLDQAQLVADEGNVRNKRYSALLLVAAQVALQMQLTLPKIEKALPLHFQRLLLDGIVDFAEQPASAHDKLTGEISIQPYEAHVMHNRWTLRALVSQSQNGYLTCSTRGEGEELSSTYQMALGDLMATHLQVAQNIQTILMNDEKQKLSLQTQLEAFLDLGMYFFSFNGYEKAYSCFSRALELMEDAENSLGKDPIMLPEGDRSNLEGYLAACEAVLEIQSVNEGPGVLKTPKLQVEVAWESRDWDKVVELLEKDIVASELTRLPEGYRAALEQQALRLLRSSSFNSTDDDPHLAAVTIRFFYKRVALQNAVRTLILDGNQEEVTAIDNCVCKCIRLLQDEIFHSVSRESMDSITESKKQFAMLVRFVLSLSGFAFTNTKSANAPVHVKQFVARILRHFPCILSLSGVSELLHRWDRLYVAEDLVIMPSTQSLDNLLTVEKHIRNSVGKQRDNFRLQADVSSMFAFSEKDTFVTALQKEIAPLSNDVALAKSGDQNNNGSVLSRNLITFCSVNNYSDMLSTFHFVDHKSPLLHCEYPRAALKGYLVAASLATNFFADLVSVVDIIDQSSLVRLSQCLIKVGAHVAAAVLYQCFVPEEFKYGLRILRQSPESHDDAFFQYFWELPFLELLVHLHSSPKHFNDRHVTLLTNLIQSPELNSSNPSPVVKDAEQRILRCYFRDLCRIYLFD
ncbi:hypothetical protein PHYBOEH_012111 [Phytophthora boehmeriae]|uniref:INTS8 TPR repeats domain-containing protein n=1 Tax=Phytophthora boehmeriae TaxID=109152 RepID=A0A8T1X1L6_9STRA|nr:hypothetical protein PHYBOEH_012111 [Phytophthora boehmeriae]